MNKAPRVDNGKSPDEPINARQILWLPPDTPYGNFQLKQLKISERIDELNRRMEEAWAIWHAMHAAIRFGSGVISNRPDLILEQCVFLMRRIADELLGMVECLGTWRTSGKYPGALRFGEIGKLWSVAPDQVPAVFKPHLDALKNLNTLANAYKHSFINTDHTQISRDEPCFFALDIKYNKLASGAKFYTLPVAPLVAAFEQMYKDVLTWLLDFSEREKPDATR
jgi:hypothetical protein